LSVMAWIEDPFGKVLLVKQTAGRKAWTFPGGKVTAKETLLAALHREVRQELGVQIEAASLIDYYDRPEKSNVTFLFRVLLKPGHQLRIPKDEIEKYAFRNSVPQLATPSLEYFWSRAQKSFEPLSLL
jgi:ADP-ribose pyrophosphatase YjhB (NUDIX family)